MIRESCALLLYQAAEDSLRNCLRKVSYCGGIKLGEV